jgi:hypothetical protein
MKTRIYVTTVLAPHEDGTLHEKNYLVDATSPHQASRHVGKKYIESQVADGKTIARMMKSGVSVEQAIADDVPPTQGSLAVEPLPSPDSKL